MVAPKVSTGPIAELIDSLGKLRRPIMILVTSYALVGDAPPHPVQVVGVPAFRPVGTLARHLWVVQGVQNEVGVEQVAVVQPGNVHRVPRRHSGEQSLLVVGERRLRSDHELRSPEVVGEPGQAPELAGELGCFTRIGEVVSGLLALRKD
jgi:hypothetical protein